MDYKLERNPNTNQWDRVVEKGDFVLIDGKEEIIQRCIINLATFYGEFFATPESGTDYFKNVYPYDHKDQELQAEFKRVINGTREVSEIVDIEFTMPDNTLILKAEIKTEDGEIATFSFNQ